MFRSILIPIDVAQESSWKFAIPEALELARASGASLRVMTVVREFAALLKGVQLPFQLEHMMADARNQLAAIVCGHDFGDVPVEQEVRYGSIGHEILAAARERSVDLIVMASHRPEMIDYMIGPNAAHVALHASCSVMVLRKFS